MKPDRRRMQFKAFLITQLSMFVQKMTFEGNRSTNKFVTKFASFVVIFPLKLYQWHLEHADSNGCSRLQRMQHAACSMQHAAACSMQHVSEDRYGTKW